MRGNHNATDPRSWIRGRLRLALPCKNVILAARPNGLELSVAPTTARQSATASQPSAVDAGRGRTRGMGPAPKPSRPPLRSEHGHLHDHGQPCGYPPQRRGAANAVGRQRVHDQPGENALSVQHVAPSRHHPCGLRRRRVTAHRELVRNEADRRPQHQPKPEVHIDELVDIGAKTTGVQRQLPPKHHGGRFADPIFLRAVQYHLQDQRRPVVAVAQLAETGMDPAVPLLPLDVVALHPSGAKAIPTLGSSKRRLSVCRAPGAADHHHVRTE